MAPSKDENGYASRGRRLNHGRHMECRPTCGAICSRSKNNQFCCVWGDHGKAEQWHKDTPPWNLQESQHLSETNLKFWGDQLVYLVNRAVVHHLDESHTVVFCLVKKCHIRNDPYIVPLMILASKVARFMPASEKTMLFNAQHWLSNLPTVAASSGLPCTTP